MTINLYLDDRRKCPDGWTLAKTVAEAQHLMETCDVEQMSLDHDLGACDACNAEVCRRTGLSDPDAAWLEDTGFQRMPHCEHVGTGYTFVRWMAETGLRSAYKPTVHSANPVGAHRMRQEIDRIWAA